jgi:large subunit ribosomal protein L24e
MTKCSFCGKEEYPHKGIHFIRNTGVVQYFCSSKCRKNLTKLKRDKRKIRWTNAFHETRDKARERAKAVVEKASLQKAEHLSSSGHEDKTAPSKKSKKKQN